MPQKQERYPEIHSTDGGFFEGYLLPGTQPYSADRPIANFQSIVTQELWNNASFDE